MKKDIRQRKEKKINKFGRIQQAPIYDWLYHSLSYNTIREYFYCLQFLEFEEFLAKYLYWHKYQTNFPMSEYEYLRVVRERCLKIFEEGTQGRIHFNYN